MTEKPVIHTEGLTKHYGDVKALIDLSLDIRKGEIFVFLGPNGAGKTTTIRILTGQLRPTSGQAWVLGCDVVEDRQALQPQIGVVFEYQNLYERLSARDNLNFAADLYGVPQSRVDQVLEQVVEALALLQRPRRGVGFGLCGRQGVLCPAFGRRRTGLGGRVHSSGGKHHTGSITKQGRTELRATAVEIAWTAVKFNPYWKEEFDRLQARIGDKKAIVAIARKILVSIWHILSHRQADIHATEDKVAYKLLLYAWQLGTQHRPDPYSAPQLTRFFLNQLDLGHDLDAIAPGGVKRLIPLACDLETLPPPFAER